MNGNAMIAASGSNSSRHRSKSRKRSGVIDGMTIRRLERICTAPSAASLLNASRTGVWLTPSSSASPRVDKLLPGVSLPVMNRCDSSACTLLRSGSSGRESRRGLRARSLGGGRDFTQLRLSLGERALDDIGQAIDLGMRDHQGRAHHDAVANGPHHEAVANTCIAHQRTRTALLAAEALVCALARDDFHGADQAERA